MIITKLVFNNFGIYAGCNAFEFNSSKPVVLIGGMNGRGKTTFLEGVLLALYGSSSFAYKESKCSSYGQYLKSFVNVADGSMETYIELEFKIEKEIDEKYLIRRSWSGLGRKTKEVIQVKKDGRESLFLTDNWGMFIENVLPSGLAGFFFFDGEKISKLAVDKTNAHMKDSIKTLLGISILDVLDKDISKIIKRVEKKSINKAYLEELETYRNRKTQAEKSLKAIDDCIVRITEKYEKTIKQLEKVKGDYNSKGGRIVTQRQDLFKEKISLEVKAEQYKENLIGLMSGELPLILVKGLLEDVKVQATNEHETKLLDYTVDKIRSMFETYTFGGDKSGIEDFIAYVEKKAAESNTENVFDVSDQSLYQLTLLLQKKLGYTYKKLLEIIEKSQVVKQRIDQIDSYLSIEIDEKNLSKLYKKIKTLEQEIISYEVDLASKQDERRRQNSDFVRANSEYIQFAENMLSILEDSDDDSRVLKYANYARRVLDEYKIRLQKNKIENLANTMTKCYKRLANKKNMINRIKMDAITLDFCYLDRDNKIVEKESLSAGEKQLMVISLLWALAICSKKKLPVIIDTPLSRMDSVHRVALIKTYFPHASDQTIILSTDSEIDQYYYEIMKDTVGDEFTLVYDDELKCSKIKKGYF